MKAIHQSSIFEGPETDKTLALDSQALEGKLYTQIARMISVCAIHGGVAPNFFSERLFNQVCDKPTARATLDEVSDVTFKEKLLKIKEARTVEDAKAAIEEAEDSLAIVGSCRIITTLKQRDALVQSAVNFFVEGRLNVALQQFVEGFTTLGLLKEMRAHPDLFHSMFVKDVRPLKASDLSTLFQVSFSASGTHKRELENQNACYWRDWLIDVEEGECAPLTLENVLEFASGASTIPPCGFFPQPTIEVFPEELGKIFPEANTCVLVLKLPVHKDYDSFKAQMCNAVLWAPTFGLV
ncbi:G2/M phase-specific E3 ubiquitin-protein ligase [Paramisgurnus dabryanus]|uniref:G2/M phase-specific E3 ubiquitin-protein ligase n=1 Tax=Paramisgurnus dabryanus TaxID=90735 RepID=UPI0031F426E2